MEQAGNKVDISNIENIEDENDIEDIENEDLTEIENELKNEIANQAGSKERVNTMVPKRPFETERYFTMRSKIYNLLYELEVLNGPEEDAVTYSNIYSILITDKLIYDVGYAKEYEDEADKIMNYILES